MWGLSYEKSFINVFGSNGAFLLVGCGGDSASGDKPDVSAVATAETEVSETSDAVVEETAEPEIVPETAEPEPVPEEPSESGDGLRPEFKEAMDSYEAFFDEYIAFMERYSASDGSDLSILADYATYMSRYAEMMEDFEAWENEEMNAAETAYYIEVQTRINQKLMDAAV